MAPYNYADFNHSRDQIIDSTMQGSILYPEFVSELIRDYSRERKTGYRAGAQHLKQVRVTQPEKEVEEEAIEQGHWQG